MDAAYHASPASDQDQYQFTIHADQQHLKDGQYIELMVCFEADDDKPSWDTNNNLMYQIKCLPSATRSLTREATTTIATA